MLNTKKLSIIRLLFKFIPTSRCFPLKALLLRWAGAEVGNNVRLMSSIQILGALDLKLGDNVFIGHETMIAGGAGSSVIIEDNAVLSSRVIVVTGDHIYSGDGVCVAKEGISRDVIISRGAVCGVASVILPGKAVGAMSHVAAGAVVTKDVPSYTRVGGVPAVVISTFDVD